MTAVRKGILLVASFIGAYGADLAPGGSMGLQFVPRAEAVVGAPLTPVSVAGVARRTTRREVVAVGAASASTTSAQAATAQQQSATAQQQSATAQQQSATAQQQQAAAATPAPAAGASGQALPLGTVVAALPAGCSQVTSGGVQYYKCGADFYRAVFQGNNLVYVTAKP
jgi:hypothetical protein